MESEKIFENINNKTLPDKLSIVDEFKSKVVDYIESDLIFQDEKTLVEDLEQIGLTFVEYKKYSEVLSKIIGYSKVEKIKSLNDYIEFLNNIKEIPSFLDGIDIIEETVDKHNLSDKDKILNLDLKIENQNELIKLLSSIYNCKDLLNENYDKVVSNVIDKYINNTNSVNAQKVEEAVSNQKIQEANLKKDTEEVSNMDILEKVSKIFEKNEPAKDNKVKEPEKNEEKIEEKIEVKKEKKSESIVDIFKELIEEELNQKENSKSLISETYEKYTLKKGTQLDCEITKIDSNYIYLKEIDKDEDLLTLKMRKLPLHNYRVGAKQKGYVAELTKTEEGVEILLTSSLQSIAAIEQKETKKAPAKSKTTRTKKSEDTGGYSEKYFKNLFNKMKSELGITMCNVKKCSYDSHFGALVIIDNKKKHSAEEIKFVESLMNKKCGEDIVKIIEFKYDAIEFLSALFEVEPWDVIKGTGKYVVVNYDSSKMAWYKHVSDEINSMVNYKIEF